MRRLAAVLFVSCLAPALAPASDVRVRYLVDAKPLKPILAGTPLTFQLFTDASCTTPVATQVANNDAVGLIAQLKPLKVKLDPTPLPSLLAELQHVMTGVTAQPLFYLKVTGPGITPVGGACQLQPATVNGSDAVVPPPTCAADSSSVAPGAPCVDRYEASVWDIPPGNTTLIQMVKDGTATLGDLTGGGATQVGVATGFGCAPSYPGSFPSDGQYTAPLYAASVPGVKPSACLTAYQAAVACQLPGKRLLTSAEWLAAAAGTPDTNVDDGSTDCNTNAPGSGVNAPVNTGSRSACVSPSGMYDAIGNVYEWMLDRTNDVLSGIPSVTTWVRGGGWGDGTIAAVSLAGQAVPDYSNVDLGFRCAR